MNSQTPQPADEAARKLFDNLAIHYFSKQADWSEAKAVQKLKQLLLAERIATLEEWLESLGNADVQLEVADDAKTDLIVMSAVKSALNIVVIPNLKERIEEYKEQLHHQADKGEIE